MDFSESYRCSLPPAFSPDGAHVAAAVEYRLVLREVDSLKVVQIYSCLDRISALAWSPNSKYVLAGLYDRGIVQLWSLHEPDWAAKIDEGPAGIKHAAWSPDGTSVLLVADFCVRLTAWSLTERCCAYLQPPKRPSGAALAFSPAGEALAVLERKDCKDWVALYSSGSWAPLWRAQLATTDAAGLSWSPDGSRLAVWDGPLAYGLVVLAAADGAVLGSFSAYGDGLGLRCAAWSPAGDMLAAGSYDQVARVLNGVTWQPLLECHHGTPVDEPADVVVYQEVEEARGVLAPVQVQVQQAKRESRARYVVRPLPVEVPAVTPPPDKPNPKLGVSSAAWSPDGRLLASVNENMGSAVWVWDVTTASLAALLLHVGGVRGLAWSPTGGGCERDGSSSAATLAVVTGNGRVYLWAPGGASIVHIPLCGFSACSLAWSPDGAALALADREAFCCAYVNS